MKCNCGCVLNIPKGHPAEKKVKDETTEQLENISIALDKISNEVYYMLQSSAHENPVKGYYAMIFRQMVVLPLKEQLANAENLQDRAFHEGFGKVA